MIAGLLGRFAPAGGPATEAEAPARRRLAFLFMGIGIVALLVIGGLTTPSFLTLENLLVVIRAASITGIIAIGMSYITISGNLFALSAEELAILAACVFAFLMRDDYGLAVSLIVTLIFAAGSGAIQGGVISLGGDPIITTLAFGALFRGIASLVSDNKNILLGTKAAEWLGTGRPLGVPTQSWAFVILTLVAWFVLQRTRFGRQLLLIGANRAAARASGLRVGQASIVAMTLFGVCCGMAGISAAAQFGLAVANLFSGLTIDVVAAVLVGGISLKGGQGSPVQAALGAVFIALLQNFMLLHSFTTGWRMLVIGSLVAHRHDRLSSLAEEAGMNSRETFTDLAIRAALMVAVYVVFAAMLPSYHTVRGAAALAGRRSPHWAHGARNRHYDDCGGVRPVGGFAGRGYRRAHSQPDHRRNEHCSRDCDRASPSLAPLARCRASSSRSPGSTRSSSRSAR